MPNLLKSIGEKSFLGNDVPYIIAEIGVNHEGSLEKAKELINLAKEGGAHAAKFQSYKARTLAVKDSPAYWDRTKEPAATQFELFGRYDSFGPKEYEELAKHCQIQDIDFLSTPFNLGAVEFLAPLMKYFKIASADITNLPLLRVIAQHQKPVLLSTGASTLAEVDVAVEELRKGGCSQIALLHCVLNYPTEIEKAHLGMITGLRRAYPKVPIGYSDHTFPDEFMTSLVTATLLGAVVIEKHFTNDKSLPGNDHYHAMDVDDLRRFVEIIQKTQLLIGPTNHKAPLPEEENARRFARRSIVTTQRLFHGQTLEETMLTTKRPATGISPLHWDEVLGKVLLRNLDADTVLKWSDLNQG